jgi:hypothetical protein
MAESMSQRGVGSRWSRWGLGAAVAALMGCATADESPFDGSESDGESVTASSAGVARAPSSQPEQAVQRLRIDPAPAGASAREARRPSAAGMVPSGAEPRARAGVPITSKHLEAELNRLEAELGN